MWTTTYTVSQILTVILYTLLCLTYIERSRKQILITNLLSHFVEVGIFILLKGYTGLAMIIFYIFRDNFFLIDAKKQDNKEITRRDVHILIILLMFVLFLSILSYENIFSMFPILATVASTIAIWQKNTKVYRFLGIICSIFWLIYHIYLVSIIAIILESLLLISTVIGFVRELKRSNSNIKYQSKFY